MKRIGAVLVFILAISLHGLAQSQPTTPPASKALFPADLVHYFSGNWAGKGKFASGKDIESDLSFVPDLENQCIVFRQKEKPPHDFASIGLWSMDSMSGDVIMLLSSNHGAGARVFHSKGWQDGKIVFQSVPELRAYWALERFTFERESATTFGATYEMSGDDGKTWRVGDHQTFTRQSAQ